MNTANANQDAGSLPTHCDALVIGAGPAGSACAQVLAQAGVQATLVNDSSFPRDKTCGDGLIGDSLAALARLGLEGEVMARAHTIGFLRCVGPTGAHVDIPGSLAVLPRRELDHILANSAQRAGAQLVTPWRFAAFLKDGSGRVCGGRFERGGEVREVQARHTVLATGASSKVLAASDLCDELAPSGFGLRGYVRNPQMVERIPHMEVVWHPRLKGGYGWIFPCGDGLFNIGVGYWTHHRKNSEMGGRSTLHTMLDQFIARYPIAQALVHTGTVEGRFKGAPLRSSLRGTRPTAPGVLVAGEAAASTYKFTGEGIGKAMETGILAAEALIAGGLQAGSDAAVAARYEEGLRTLAPKYEFYERANLVNNFPWMAELAIRKAARSDSVRRKLTQLLDEKMPARPLTVGNVLRRLLAA